MQFVAKDCVRGMRFPIKRHEALLMLACSKILFDSFENSLASWLRKHQTC